MNSVNTNYGALVALQNLNKTNNELGEVQNRINTGLKVSSARDNGAIYAIAEGQRARVGALASVKDGIDRASIVIDTAIAAGESIGTLMKEMRKKAVDAQAADLSSAQKPPCNATSTSCARRSTRLPTPLRSTARTW